MAERQNSFDLRMSQNYQPFKLIELPQELLDSLQSASPPTLSIKPTSISTTTTSNIALLIHGTQKYKMNTRNSSNTTLLLRPSSVELNAVDGSNVINSVTAIAQCDETIELVPYHETLEKEARKVNKWHDKFAKSKQKGEKYL
ncbi:putative sister chromatid cohesion protein dcc1 [Erysiphe neolycopersici]|uniref:Putative sister chromatid cohesion protein dcc1 n=1 Tax=Erysiphe neolycopersici TaxID=212602 RepID=A0A420I5J8_9PEZI|nr:putative sister chromatid cohesion protein dcc1 [Erysiphe neolycopersici]